MQERVAAVSDRIPFYGMGLRTVRRFSRGCCRPVADQTQPGHFLEGELSREEAIGLRYQGVSKFVPADARPVRCSTTSRLNSV